MAVILDGGGLTIEDVCAVAEGMPVEVGAEGVAKAEASRKVLERLEQSGELIYGVNTGFGPLRSVRIAPDKGVLLQENLIRSHAAGVGVPLSKEDVRAAMLLTAATHFRGCSGVGPMAGILICEWLNAGRIPAVPSRGSLGASGDLAPLAHIALALMDEGGLRMESKLGLSLINGTHVHTAMAARIVREAEVLAKASDIACSMMVEALLCSAQPFRADVQALRPHVHQEKSARNVWRLVDGSEIIPSHANCGEVQDAYSIRCAPQVHGAARQTIAHLREVVQVELRSVTDNPLVIGDEVVSAGHFHGEPVGLALDYCKIGIAELAAISERRIERALNADYNRGLPAFLVRSPGLQSGLMLAHYTAAALVSENKVLSHPSCVDSIPTGANQEDHVSMAMNAALHARQVVENLRRVIAIELLVGAQALDCRREVQSDAPGKGVRAAWDAVRDFCPPVLEDRSLSDEIERLDVFKIVTAVEREVGELE